MKRRTVLRSFAGVLIARPLVELGVDAQAPATTATLTDANVATLHAIGEVVLPESIGASRRRVAIERFVAWVRNYKTGADRGHGYGDSRLTAATGPSPARQYPAQFDTLDSLAKAQGAASFAALAIATRRTIVEAQLNTPQPINRLAARPTGANLIADVVGFYFASADGYNLAYNAQIDRDSCRSLDGSDRAPAPLRAGGGD